VALGQSGRVYIGGNLEFPGSTLASSVHAEQCLTANLLRHREPGILAVAISAPPCGHCRQFFSEMCCVVGPSCLLSFLFHVACACLVSGGEVIVAVFAPDFEMKDSASQ